MVAPLAGLTVLLDLDDTLCDYQGARERAKRKINGLLATHGVTSPTTFWARFEEIDPGLFDKFAAGELGREEYRSLRFALPAAEQVTDRVMVDRVATEANSVYVNSANTDIELFADALPALDAVRASGARSALFTNGPSDGQRAKIVALGLADHLDHVFISEELGAAKPSEDAFRAVLDSLGIGAEQAVMVGDSPATDIAGAAGVGMRSVLVDRGGRHPGSEVPVVSDLTTLPELLAD